MQGLRIPEQQRNAQADHRMSGRPALGRQTHDLSEMGQTDLDLLDVYCGCWCWCYCRYRFALDFTFVRETISVLGLGRADSIRTTLASVNWHCSLQ